METLDTVQADPVLRLTALFHDIAKPRVREKIEDQWRFRGHEKAGAELSAHIMKRLKFSKKIIEMVRNLIEHHMILYDSRWSDGAVRRLIRRVGPENMEHLLLFRRADLLAHGYGEDKLMGISELENRVREMGMEGFVKNGFELAVDGNTVMEIMDLPPGPAVGKIIKKLMNRVTEHPEWNNEGRLVSILKEMKGARNSMGFKG
jgi:putative nucleotidyltransferase with HDIG domain